MEIFSLKIDEYKNGQLRGEVQHFPSQKQSHITAWWMGSKNGPYTGWEQLSVGWT